MILQTGLIRNKNMVVPVPWCKPRAHMSGVCGSQVSQHGSASAMGSPAKGTRFPHGFCDPNADPSIFAQGCIRTPDQISVESNDCASSPPPRRPRPWMRTHSPLAWVTWIVKQRTATAMRSALRGDHAPSGRRRRVIVTSTRDKGGFANWKRRCRMQNLTLWDLFLHKSFKSKARKIF